MKTSDPDFELVPGEWYQVIDSCGPDISAWEEHRRVFIKIITWNYPMATVQICNYSDHYFHPNKEYSIVSDKEVITLIKVSYDEVFAAALES